MMRMISKLGWGWGMVWMKTWFTLSMILLHGRISPRALGFSSSTKMSLPRQKQNQSFKKWSTKVLPLSFSSLFFPHRSCSYAWMHYTWMINYLYVDWENSEDSSSFLFYSFFVLQWGRCTGSNLKGGGELSCCHCRGSNHWLLETKRFITKDN